MKTLKTVSTALSLTLLLQTIPAHFASAEAIPSIPLAEPAASVSSSVYLPPVPAWGHFVDTYKTNQAANNTPTSNAAIGMLSQFLELWTPGSSWDNGTKLNSSVLDANIQKVVDIAAKRTPAEADMAYYDDRRKQSYGVIDGLGSLTDVYRTNAGATTTINDIPADATTKKYDDGGTDAGDPNSNFGRIVTLVKTLRGNYSSTNPAKNFYAYKRPFRWAGTSIIVPSLVPAISKTPETDGGYPSGHTNASYLSAFAMAYAVPERYQELLTRASEMGSSRIVSGMHSPMDVMGGRIMATALSAAILADPDNAAVKQAAYDEAHAKLLTQTGTAEDRFSDYAKNKAQFTERLTYGFSQIGDTSKPMTVPKGAEVLLETRLPYLDGPQRREVLATTGLPSGYPVLDDPEGWGRLNLFAAADGYGAFHQDVTVTMDAYQGGFHAADRWRNDISGTGRLTKAGSGTLKLQGGNTYSGGTQIIGGLLVGESPSAFGTGDVAVNEGSLAEQVSGSMTIGGNYTQAAGGTLELNVGGAQDLLEIKGAAQLNGKLRLNFTDAYVPGGVMTILTHAKDQRTGQFAFVETNGLPSQYKANVSYLSDRIQVAVENTSSSSGSDSSSSSSPAAPAADPKPAEGAQPADGALPAAGDRHKMSVSVPAAVDENGRAAAALQASQLSDLLNKINSQAAEVMVAELKVEPSKQAKSVELTLSKEAIGKLSDGKAKTVAIVTPFGMITLSKDVLERWENTAGDAIRIGMAPADTAKFADEAKSLIGTRPALQVTLHSGTSSIKSFGGSRIGIQISYQAVQGEDTNALGVSEIDVNGKPHLLPQSAFSPRDGQASILTDHPGTYAVSYNRVSFTDTSAHWAGSYVTYLAARGIASGSGDSTFAPDASITRAEFVKLLAGIAHADGSGFTASAFTDVQAGDWHMPYVAWAAQQKLVEGDANGQFRPDARISREELCVMLNRFTGLTGYSLPSAAGDAGFADQHLISPWAADAVSALYQAGFIAGKDNRQFDPQGSTTRAEAAKLLAVFLQGMVEQR
ncbi:S-layer homology domain-containing protein [Paenibacillus mucilaginosus]|uniref:Putative phosphoesterase n=1 Tax=Paenibacillus mucilaginosus (strain KNP414) TaxID=1036673 RepID=F8FLR8_PAEMK|nr:S-layer homology domain-containing protein [Paenibacillus mucilaginosus]AEI44834.1 putative phosphoesterase [Paenibacillus mucilaginosus KNP414]MCG7214880.1 S-layer homology domain-containing protein [Paenibacillus mucilaginosus]WDM26360.1 S-layer homology domain-containing protein [Paenibacillus mucilaginosus]